MTNSGNVERPERLLAGDRVACQTFQPDELLFRRCLPEHVTDDGEVLAEAFRFPELSVVRAGGDHLAATFEPDDARWLAKEACREGQPDYERDTAVAGVPVSSVPPEIARDGAAPYILAVGHTPYVDHYPHCDVDVFKEGKKIVGSEGGIKSAARRRMRELFALASRVVDPAPPTN